jgi:hypothetical protein
MAMLPGMLTPTEWEVLYHQIAHVISEEPDVQLWNAGGCKEILRWLGRVEILIQTVSGLADDFRFQKLKSTLLTTTQQDHEIAKRYIRSLLYTALAKAELNAPSATRGAFIPANSPFDALIAVGGVLRACTGSVLIVDPYLDPVVLTDFLPMVADGVHIRLLASTKQRGAGLPEAVERWNTQNGNSRHIDIRLAASQQLHDRLIMDDRGVWSLSQSFNSIAKRSPAMIQRVSADIAEAKREAFTSLWVSATSA